MMKRKKLRPPRGLRDIVFDKERGGYVRTGLPNQKSVTQKRLEQRVVNSKLRGPEQDATPASPQKPRVGTTTHDIYKARKQRQRQDAELLERLKRLKEQVKT